MLHQNYYLVTFIKGNGNIFLPRPKFLTIRRSCRFRIRTRKVPLRFWGITNSSRRTCWTVSRERLFIPETQKENGFNLNLSFDTHSCKIVAALEYRAQQETWLALWNDEKGFWVVDVVSVVTEPISQSSKMIYVLQSHDVVYDEKRVSLIKKDKNY